MPQPSRRPRCTSTDRPCVSLLRALGLRVTHRRRANYLEFPGGVAVGGAPPTRKLREGRYDGSGNRSRRHDPGRPHAGHRHAALVGLALRPFITGCTVTAQFAARRMSEALWSVRPSAPQRLIFISLQSTRKVAICRPHGDSRRISAAERDTGRAGRR